MRSPSKAASERPFDVIGTFILAFGYNGILFREWCGNNCGDVISVRCMSLYIAFVEEIYRDFVFQAALAFFDSSLTMSGW